MKVIEFPRIKGDRRRPKAVFTVNTDGTIVGRVQNAQTPQDRRELLEALDLAKAELKKRVSRNKP